MIYTMKNKYIHHIIKTFARISEAKRIKNKIDFKKKILKYISTSLTLVAFARSLDIEAVKNAKICKDLQKNINKICDKFCKNIKILIAKECEKISKMQGEIEIDKSNLLI